MCCCCAGLLLNTLSVFRGCEIVFDSLDVPEEALAAAADGHADVQARAACLRKRNACLSCAK